MAPEGQEANPYGGISTEFWYSADHISRLAIKLLAETQKGALSALDPWIETLPRAPFTPMFWTDAQLAELQYPPIVASIRRQAAEWRDRWADVGRKAPDAISWADFAWALSVVRSRAISGELRTSEKGFAPYWFLVPWLDMVNSKSGVPTDIRLDSYGNRLELFAGYDVSAGQQLFISYGKDNDDLLQYFGFVEPDNPQDGYCVTGVLDTVVDGGFYDLDVFQERVAAVQAAGLGRFLDALYISPDAAYLPCIQALRILLAPVGEDPLHAKDQPSEETERRVARVVQEAVRRGEASWSTTLEADRALPRYSGDQARDLALAYRIEKKAVLRRFLHQFPA